MEDHHPAEDENLESNTDELENLEEDVKLMAQKIADFRQTLPEQLKKTLTSIISAQRPPNSNDDSDPGPSRNSNLDVRAPLDLEDPTHTEKVQTIKQKITNNASAMSLLVNRMNVCISRMDELDSFKQEMIHPAFTRKRTNSETSGFSEQLTDDFTSCSSDTNSPVCCSGTGRSDFRPTLSRFGAIRHYNKVEKDDHKLSDQKPTDLELEMMKERFSKLLLGEDMSGGGKGVSTAVTVSNAITNLYVSVFGHHQRLEPLYPDKKRMWKREMTCLLSVCDYIVEFVPASQNLQNKPSMEMMKKRPRSDIDINLPALIKLDALLIEILDSFEETEFWYDEQGSMSGNLRSGSFRGVPQPQRTEDKWWLPLPCVPAGGLSETANKHLKQKRDSANQIHKAAMAINSSILSDMTIPHSYITSLPKSGRTSVGDTIYRYMISTNRFSPEYLLDCLNISSEHEALELADRIEASMYTWRQKACSNYPKSSWETVKEHMEGDKNVVLAERAEILLFSLKQRFPELAQTTLDTSKIQYNKDVGQAILESYSRVLEGLAYNIVGWIEDVLFVDKSMTNQQEET